MWIVEKKSEFPMYYTGKDKQPWSSALRNARVYESPGGAQDAIDNIQWPTAHVVVVELPWTGP